MYPKSFQYVAPQTISEAIKILGRSHGEAKVLAGGQSLIPLMKLRLFSPQLVVDINRVKGLSYIKQAGKKTIRIGSLTRMNEVESSSLLQKVCPIITETASTIADYQVRNRGTIGGNIAHGDPSNDMPTTMLALNASFVVRGPTRTRIIHAERFFLDVLSTALRPSEILTEIRFPIPPQGTGGAFLKHERVAGDFAVVSVGALVTLDKRGTCTDARIAVGSAGPTAMRAKEAEAALTRRPRSAEATEEAARKASERSSPFSDIRGSADYKKEMVRVFTKRALDLAFQRAEGSRAAR